MEGKINKTVRRRKGYITKVMYCFKCRKDTEFRGLMGKFFCINCRKRPKDNIKKEIEVEE